MWHRGIFSLGCFPSKTDVTVSFIVHVRSSPNQSGLKTLPFSLSQTSRTALRDFPFRTRFEKVIWCFSSVWFLWAFRRYPISGSYMSFMSLSKAPWFQKLSKICIRLKICVEILTPWVRCRITDWKTITLYTFHFLVQTHQVLHTGFQQIISRLSRKVCCSVV